MFKRLINKIASYAQHNAFLIYFDAYPSQTLALITLLAFAIGLVVMVLHPPSPNNGGTHTWWEIILNLVNGQGYSFCSHNYFPFCGPTNQISAAREPAPILIFALSALLFQKSIWAAAILELVIYVGILLALYALTNFWGGTRAAILASLIWATYFPGLKLIPQVSGDLLATLGIIVGIYFFMRARRENLNRFWLFSGVGLGLAVMSRSASLIIVFVVAGGVLLERLSLRGKWDERLRPALLICMISAAMMLPWMIRNQIALGRPVLGSSLTGYNIYRHNYMLSSQNYLHYVGADEGYQAVQALLTRRADLLGTENEAQMDLVYRQEGIKIIRAHPIQYAFLSAYRFLPLWFDWRVNEAYGIPSSRLDYLIMVQQAFLLLLAIPVSIRQARETWPLWSSILFFSFIYMLIDSRLRYLVPVMPLVVSLAATGAVKILQLANKTVITQ